MNLPAIVSLAGILCYASLTFIVLRRGLSGTGAIHRLFLANLAFMALWQCTDLAVSIARDQATAAT
jgi:hypothetical protein